VSLRGLADVITDFFFDELAIEDVERVPLDGPVILAANHHSGLMDAMLLYATTPRDLRAVGKSTLWKIWPLRPFLAAGRVIPIYRERDGGGDNTNAFAAVADALSDGGAVAIFAEGTSHDRPGLERIRTGTARMAFDAIQAGARPLIVPVGLIFEDRERFRSDALVRFGSAIDVAAEFPNASSDDRESVRELTAQITAALGKVAPTWENEQQRAAARTAAMRQLPIGATLGEVEAEAERLAALGGTSEADERFVGVHGEAELHVRPEEIDPVSAAILWPFAMVGKLTNLPPYATISLVSRRSDRNIRATIKSAAAMILFPIWWAIIAVAGRWFGLSWTWALGVAGIVAVLGIIAARELPLARDERRTRSLLREG